MLFSSVKSSASFCNSLPWTYNCLLHLPACLLPADFSGLLEHKIRTPLTPHSATQALPLHLQVSRRSVTNISPLQLPLPDSNHTLPLFRYFLLRDSPCKDFFELSTMELWQFVLCCCLVLWKFIRFSNVFAVLQDIKVNLG